MELYKQINIVISRETSFFVNIARLCHWIDMCDVLPPSARVPGDAAQAGYEAISTIAGLGTRAFSAMEAPRACTAALF